MTRAARRRRHALLALTVAVNVLVVGAALGAYGDAHGGRDAAARPARARRLRARARPLPARPPASRCRRATCSRSRRRRLPLLAVGGVLETFVAPERPAHRRRCSLLAAGALAVSALSPPRYAADAPRHASRSPRRPRHQPTRHAARTTERRSGAPERRAPPRARSRPALRRSTPRRAGRRGSLGHRACRLLIARSSSPSAPLGSPSLAGALAVAPRPLRGAGARYALYELHLSPHDEAKPQDLEDMVEAIANLVRAFPAERARARPAVRRLRAAHLTAAARARMEWSLGVRCEPARSPSRSTPRSTPPTPTCGSATAPASHRNRAPAARAIPRHVLRFRKQRSFVYPLLAAGDALASPPLEADRARPGRARRAVGRALPAHPRAGLVRGARAPPATAATRTGSCARSAGACPRAA